MDLLPILCAEFSVSETDAQWLIKKAEDYVKTHAGNTVGIVCRTVIIQARMRGTTIKEEYQEFISEKAL